VGFRCVARSSPDFLRVTTVTPLLAFPARNGLTPELVSEPKRPMDRRSAASLLGSSYVSSWPGDAMRREMQYECST
jgi:hypothetical protein